MDRAIHPSIHPSVYVPSRPSHPPTHLPTHSPLASQDEGEAVKIRAVKEAEAEAARTEIQAKADAEAKFLAGQGIARQRQASTKGLEPSPHPCAPTLLLSPALCGWRRLVGSLSVEA